jgi:hypothetical protein
MDRGRVGEDRGSKETDGCPLTDKATHLNTNETEEEVQGEYLAFD